jgi:hypothetical protein
MLDHRTLPWIGGQALGGEPAGQPMGDAGTPSIALRDAFETPGTAQATTSGARSRAPVVNLSAAALTVRSPWGYARANARLLDETTALELLCSPNTEARAVQELLAQDGGLGLCLVPFAHARLDAGQRA